MSEELVCVKRFSNRLDAEVVKSFLRSQNITSFIFSDDEGGWFPFPLGKSGVQLCVGKDDYQKAQGLLSQN